MYQHFSFSPDEPPRAYLGGTEHNLPFVKFSDDVSMLLDLSDDGAAVLRETAARLLALADDIDAHLNARQQLALFPED